MNKILGFMFCFFNIYANDTLSRTIMESCYLDQQVEIRVQKPLESNDILVLFLHGANSEGIGNLSIRFFDHWSQKKCVVAPLS